VRPIRLDLTPTASFWPVWRRLVPAALLLVAGCRHAAGGAGVATRAPVRFVDVTREAGIRFRHTSGRSDRNYLAQTMGSGCAFLDYNGDGRLDLFFVNSSRLPGFAGKGPHYPALYRNEGGGRFADVTRQAGLQIDCYGMGVAVADYDNDGATDLLLTAYGGSHLFHNGHGRFTEVTRQAGITGPGTHRVGGWGTSAAWFDYDRDGALDLFICNYLRWSPVTNKVCGEKGLRYACSPSYYPSTSSVLYHNNGNGTFTDVTHRAKVDAANGKALGVVVWDMDDDGWPDFAVANDSEPNWLFRNNRDGTFTEVGVEAGVAYGPQGRQRSGMGIDTADYELTGREALVVGNLSGEGLAFFRPTETAGQYTDDAEAVGLFQASLPFTTFGARFLDYDLDGYPDLVTANGHVIEEVSANAGAFRYEQRLQLFHNEPGASGQRLFRDVTAAAGPALNQPRTGRGLAVGDVDGDGDPDLLVSANNGVGLLLQNEGAPRGHWLAVKLAGTGGNREGIGARIRVTAGGLTRTGWIRSGGSYGSEDERVARFGLGEQTRADRVEVRWPDGKIEQRANVPANQMLVIGGKGG
jgi:enediyne biosynthesis protein E4